MSDIPSLESLDEIQVPPEAEDESQDNFVESRDPTELVMCIILSSAYAGLAKYCWEPLRQTENWRLLVNVEGFFLTIALLSFLVGLRPYLSPCSLQLSNKGIKYRGPYWPQRKTVNWSQVFRLYMSPELIVVLYHPSKKNKGIWPLIIQSVYLSDREKIEQSILKYSPVEAVLLSNPGWPLRLMLLSGFVLIVIFILQMLMGGTLTP
jgi:hypothetical protein